jgi:hypothetical protein
MGILLFIIALPIIIGAFSIVVPLILAVVTLPFQALAVANEEEKAAAEAKK